MTILQESDLQFQFNKEWRIKKYDATDYYLAISGSGMSAVDFVGLWRNTVVFIEVKNYRNRPQSELTRSQSKLTGDMPPLVSTFAEKVRESIVGISVIRKFLLRKWIYKHMDKLLTYPRLLPYLLGFEQLFWMYLDRKIKANPAQVHLILWLEVPEELQPMTYSFRHKLVAELSSQFNKVEVGNVEMKHLFDGSISTT